jgi:hypothetical protein
MRELEEEKEKNVSMTRVAGPLPRFIKTGLTTRLVDQ